MPPAVALLNYTSSGLLWRIFCQTGTFRGVFSISNNAVRISAAAMGGAGDIIIIKKNKTKQKVRTAQLSSEERSLAQRMKRSS